MFLFAGIVGGIKGLFWGPAHVMRALAACLQVLQTPPAESAPAAGPTQFHRAGGLRQTLAITSLRCSSHHGGRCVSLQFESNPPAGSKSRPLMQGYLPRGCLVLIHLKILSGPTAACPSVLWGQEPSCFTPVLVSLLLVCSSRPSGRYPVLS